MDNNMKWLKEKKINNTIKALKENNMNGYLAKNKEELISIVETLIKEGDIIGCGGSMSLFELGVIDYLRNGKYKFLDRYQQNLTTEEIGNIYRNSFFADAYFTSSNAITEDGQLYNVDGNGNRVAAMMFGPKKVIVIAGVNKIVKNIDDAIKRNREIAAPANAKRLNKATPCAEIGYCMDCKSKEKICREFTVIKSQGDTNRIHVIFLNEEIGY